MVAAELALKLAVAASEALDELVRVLAGLTTGVESDEAGGLGNLVLAAAVTAGSAEDDTGAGADGADAHLGIDDSQGFGRIARFHIEAPEGMAGVDSIIIPGMIR